MILVSTVAYLNVTIKVNPETRNRILEPTSLAKPGETCGLTETGPCLARQESEGSIYGRDWNRTNPDLRSHPRSLAGYLDPLLTQSSSVCGNVVCELRRINFSRVSGPQRVLHPGNTLQGSLKFGIGVTGSLKTGTGVL
jgi:hypothetical protein